MNELTNCLSLVSALFFSAGILLILLIRSSAHGNMSAPRMTKLCMTGFVSAAAQAVVVWNIRLSDTTLLIALAVVTLLAFAAGLLVFWRLHREKITDSTASYLILVGHVVYPAFLVVFMFWSWDTV